MAMRTIYSFRCGFFASTRRWLLPLSVLLVFGLSGCDTIVGTWRNVTGASKNDAELKAAPNAGNLAAGKEIPYPNLATVPGPPTGGMTKAELDKLTQNLIADRTHAKYNGEELRAGVTPAIPAPPPPPPPPPLPQTASQIASGTGAASAAVPSGRLKRLASRQPGEPPAPGPMESSLEMPRIRPLPQPGSVAPSPPRPGLHARPVPQEPSLPTPPPTGSFAPPPASLPPASKSLASIAPKKAAKPAAKRTIKLAEIAFPPQSTSLSPVVQKKLGALAPFFHAHPGIIRVIGYAGDSGGALAQLNSFSEALNRAEAVAAALTKAGIPATKIKVEAAPTSNAFAPPHADILLEE